jgi:hypothetical protein
LENHSEIIKIINCIICGISNPNQARVFAHSSSEIIDFTGILDFQSLESLYRKGLW